MALAKISTKGQLTLPKVVREALQVREGDSVLFVVQPDGEIRLQAVRKRKLVDLYGALPATRPYPGRDELRATVKKELAKWDWVGK